MHIHSNKCYHISYSAILALDVSYSTLYLEKTNVSENAHCGFPDQILSPSKLYFTKCIAFGHKLNNLSRQRLVRLVTVQTLGCVRSHGSTWVPAESMSNQNLKNKSCLKGEHEALICKILNHPQENRIGLNYVKWDWTYLKFMPGPEGPGRIKWLPEDLHLVFFALSERISWIIWDFWCFDVFCVFCWERE